MVDAGYEVDPVPAYVNVTEPTASLPIRVETENVGETATPYETDNASAATAADNAFTVAVAVG